MARMVPSPMLPVQSGAEEQLYDALRDQLPDEFICYHGIEWLHLGGRPQKGEADFLIAHAELGVLVLEVKGGQLTYDPPSRTWKRRGDPKRVKDPFAQAQRCMNWLMREPEHLPKKWMASLGYGVGFPNGEYREQAHPNAPLDLVIDHRDMGELATHPTTGSNRRKAG
ncbi:MAG: NERD domain-containing protein [Actinomycetota bacterium]